MPEKPTLEVINRRLKAAKIGVTVEQRGERLALRATLPPKPGSAKAKPHQQYLSLGVYVNPAGLQYAEAEAKVVGGLLATGKFDWGKYLGEEAPLNKGDWGKWIEKYRRHYFDTRGDTPQTQLTWKNDYQPAFKLLDGEASEESLTRAAGATTANTRTRKRTIEKLEVIAKFAGIEVDIAAYRGNYGQASLKPRELPTDSEIEEYRLQLINPAWQWAYGIMACYGLRDHEVFFCKVSEVAPHICEVLEGKTGAREVYPLLPRWAVEWKLWEVCKPDCTGNTYRDYGQRVCQYFNRRKLPFSPYDLRHAYAIRGTLQYKIPVVTMAAWMGHQPSVHWNTYNRWISGSEHKRAFYEATQ